MLSDLIISCIEKEDSSKNYAVFIDEEKEFTVLEHDIYKLGLYKGKEINKKELELLKHQAQFSYAKLAAVRYVSFKIRTAHEIRKKLEQNYDAGIIDEIIDFLINNGYIDDGQYAEKFIKEKLKSKKYSKRYIKQQLKLKGIDENLIDTNLSRADSNELESAKLLVKKKLKARTKIDLVKIKQYLYRKGFDIDTINQALKEI